jgi:hypothetical protein
MTPAEIRAIVQALPITAAQLDAVMGAGIGSVSRWQTGAVTPTAPVLRLLRAYADGYRPTDWPEEESMNERYRIKQEGQPVAWAEGVRARAQILHYAAVYAQDGPIAIERHNGKRWVKSGGIFADPATNEGDKP